MPANLEGRPGTGADFSCRSPEFASSVSDSVVGIHSWSRRVPVILSMIKIASFFRGAMVFRMRSWVTSFRCWCQTADGFVHVDKDIRLINDLSNIRSQYGISERQITVLIRTPRLTPQ